MNQRPNVLFVMADELRADVAYHDRYPFVKTPHLDRLRSDGVTFRNAFCQTPTCVPSRASVNCGLYPQQMGILNHGCRIGEDFRTWGHHFAAAGYESVAFGKTHGMNPGFEVMPEPDYRKALGTTNVGNHSDSASITGLYDGDTDDYLEFAVAKQFEDFIERRDATQPFAAHVGFLAPHPPFFPPKAYADLYPPESIELPEVDPDAWRSKSAMQRNKSLNQWLCHPVDIRKKIISYYLALTTLADEAFGRLRASLEKRGLWENTVVVFTADHGDQLGEHDLVGKFWHFYEGSLRAPLVIRAPDMKKSKGRQYESLAQLIDLFPTMADLAGVPAPETLPGRSLAPILRRDQNDPNPHQDHRDAVFCAIENGRMIRTRTWKLCVYANEQPELYDLAHDPDEHTNRYADPACRDMREQLKDRLMAHDIRYGYVQQPRVPLDHKRNSA